MTDEGILLDLGFRGYEETWRLQHDLVDRRAGGLIPDTLILVEHPHIYTLGRRAPGALELPGDVPSIRIDRGGDVTYHGPGQLVAYPILRLDTRGLDIRGYISALEEAVIRTLGRFDIDAGRGPQTGVWVGGRKIASIGIAVRHWVTFHGVALNVNTDLEYFRRIRPCGLEGSTITSMEEVLARRVYLPTVQEEFRRRFQEVFDLELRPMDESVLGLLRGPGEAQGAPPPKGDMEREG